MIFTEEAVASLRRISGTVAATVDRKFFSSFFYLCNLVGAASLDFSAVKTVPFFWRSSLICSVQLLKTLRLLQQHARVI